MGLKKKYLMMVLLLMGMVIATSSCNKEEPEEIIEEEEEVENEKYFQLPDSEFEFDQDAAYLYTKPYYTDYWNVVTGNGYINGVNYANKFNTHVSYNSEGKILEYLELVRVFSNEEDLLNSDFSTGYEYYKKKGLIDFSKQSYIVICWIQPASHSTRLMHAPLKIYKKDNKLSFRFLGVAGGVFHTGVADFFIVIVDEPNLKQGYVRARCG